MRVPFFDLKAQYEGLREEILASLDRVCGNASFILGEEVAEFEKEFAHFCEAKYCVALNSGTSALHAALLAVGVGPGDEVVTTTNTFVATAEAISYTGAKPVLVDIDPMTGNLDPGLVERAVTKRTKAIVPVHLYGRPANLHPILEIAHRYHLPVIEDACQAHGARYRGKRVGGLAEAAAFSFYPSKNLGAYGEAGALITNHERIRQFAKAMRDHGQVNKYVHEFIGYNYRMDGFQGAVLRVKLKRLETLNRRRLELATSYRKLLTDARLDMPSDNPEDECVYHLFVIYVNDRDCVRTRLQERGVQTAVHYPRPIHLQKAYASLGYEPGTFPHAEQACERVLSLPFFPEMSSEQLEYVVAVTKEIVGKK